MDASIAALLGTLVGAFSGLGVTIVTFRLQGRREWQQARAATVARVAQSLAALQVAMDWIIWLGEHQPKNLSEEEIRDYSRNVMPRFSELLGAVALLGSYDARLDERFLDFYEQALGLDEKVNHALEGNGPPWKSIAEEANGFFKAWKAAIQEALRQSRG